jgi:hypothetical protein
MQQKYNYDLFAQIVEQIEKDPALFDMDVWEEKRIGGTARCIASLACFLSGLELPFDSTSHCSWYIETAEDLLCLNYKERKILFLSNLSELIMYLSLKKVVDQRNFENQQSIEEIFG